ncbi:hypothetical protein BDD12DRAFT_804921 [Trichophaea hybrida]|nr:hypothetical protein BDD12DRAFT_804921 [Trichophaea hybrida]
MRSIQRFQFNRCLKSVSTLFALLSKAGFEEYEARLWKHYWEGIEILSVAGETSHFDENPKGEPTKDTLHIAEPYHQEHDESRAGLSNSELDECFVDIPDVITCLYEFSVTIRNSAPRDGLEKCRDIDVSHYEFYDVQHVENKFRGAEKYLIDCLGRANTRRRQLLKYHEIHHEKIAGRYPGVPVEEDPTIVPSQEDRNISDMSKLSLHEEVNEIRDIDEPDIDWSASKPPTIAPMLKTQTTVSIIIQGETPNFSSCSETDQSQTSFALTISGAKMFSLYPLTPRSRVLTTESLFFVHIVIKSYKLPADVLGLFQNHLQMQHSRTGIFNDDQVQTVIDRCERPQESKQLCPLCGEMQSTQHLRRHLGSHMQQVALFVPRTQEDKTNVVEVSLNMKIPTAAEEFRDLAVKRISELGLEQFYLTSGGIRSNLETLIGEQYKSIPNVLPNLGLTKPFAIDLTTVSLYDVMILAGK